MRQCAIAQSQRSCSLQHLINHSLEQSLNKISDADSKRKILITVKCIMAFKKWREIDESFREDRYRCIEGRCLHQIM